MAYTPNEWSVGNLITASKMNKIERQLVANTSDLDDIRNGVTVPTYDEFETLRDDVAAEYDNTKTYAVGDYVIYNTQLYKCKTAITSAETWTVAHWDAVEVGEELQRIEEKNEEEVAELKSALDELSWVINSQMIDKNNLNELEGYVQQGSKIVSASNMWTFYLPISTNTYYTLTNESDATRFSAFACVGQPVIGDNTAVWSIPAVNENGIWTFNSGNATYMAIYYFNRNTETKTKDQILSKIKLENGTTSTASTEGYTYGKKTFVVSETYLSSGVKEKLNQSVNAPKKYGLKWLVSDPDDLGSRCFDAVGMSTTAGIGAANGASDFDNIYPWSEMKRCNIKVNSAGAKIITWEGETGFALDGTNGDVFVRIPKFYIEKYKENGYEYRVVSGVGTNIHPVFIENGRILDEIFVGAFEGYIDGTLLKSKSGIIPSSNEKAQTFLTAAENNGVGFSIYDSRCVDAIWTLMAVEFGCRNTNQIIGYGFADFVQPVKGSFGINYDGETTTTNVFSCPISIPAGRMNMMLIDSNVNICKGDQKTVIATRKLTAKTSDNDHYYLTFDGDPVELDSTCFIGSAACTTNFCESAPSGALSWHTGRANWVSGSITKNPVRYRWIENLVGSLWALLPDVTFNDLQMYVCKNIDDYSIGATANGYVPVNDVFTVQTSNGNKGDVEDANYWINSLAEIPFADGTPFGKSWDTSLISTQAFGGYYYLNTGKRIIANGGGFDHLYRCNMLTNRAWIAPDDIWYLYGARLIYKNLD